MKNKKTYKIKITDILLAISIVLFFGCQEKEPGLSNKEISKIQVSDTAKDKDSESKKATEFATSPPPFSDGIFPCNDCHGGMVPNPARRELIDFHDDISAIYNHDKENRWCLDCHDLNNRDSLKLASGKLLDFKESYKLCGQCHGDKYRDWKVGVHGKRTGEWNGNKEYLLCVNCHNPHSPKFQEMTPEPPPVRQEEIK